MTKPKKSIDETSASNIRNGILNGVGYGRPPEHTRFKKGQSGNPAGRPRASAKWSEPSQLGDIVLAEAARLLKVTDNVSEREITAEQALVKASFKSAVQGNAHAQDRLLTRIQKAERERDARIERENAVAENYVETQRAVLAATRAAGLPDPEIYPHPDDIVIEAGRPWRLVGPATKEAAAEFEKMVKLRDLLIRQSTLVPVADRGQVSVELLLAFLLNDRLPLRMRLDDDAWSQLMWRCYRSSNRQLAKQIQQGWRELGVDVPRGATFPVLDADILKRRLSDAMATKATSQPDRWAAA